MTAPDPQIVREIARKHLAEFMDRYPMADAFFVGSRVLEACGDPELWQTDPQAYRNWCDAVVADVRLAVPSWPDEQQPADPVIGEQQDGAAVEVSTFLDALPPRIDIVADWTRGGVRNVLTAEALRAVLAERDNFRAQLRTELAISAELRQRNVELATERCHAEAKRDALATRVAELEAEREADTRVAARLIASKDGTVTEMFDASDALEARFADRIAALDADAAGEASDQ